MKTHLNKITNHRYIRFAVAVGILAMFTISAGAASPFYGGG